MTSPFKTDQMTLPGLETALCKCGCGTYFMRAAHGKRREYLNDTHKKRVARRKRKDDRRETQVRLGPLGFLYLRTESLDEANYLWSVLDGSQRSILAALCSTGLSAEAIMDAVTFLFWKGE